MRRFGLLLLLVPLVAACNGGTVDPHALTNDSAAIDSLACEGALLANQVAHDASTSPFTRVHAGELAQRASNFEDALSQRPTAAGIEQTSARSRARPADRRLLEQLTADPDDRAARADLERRLARTGGCP